MTSRLLSMLAGASLAVAASAAIAADYPSKTITMIVPYAAGGGTDTVARIAVPGLEKALSAKIVVKNVTGAGGTIGASELAASTADGYTIGFMPIGTMTTQPHLRKVPYNGDSWSPICRLVKDPMSVLVAPDSKIKSMDDLIAMSTNGNQLKSAGPPPGSLPHIGQAALASAYGMDLKYVPHEGGAAVAKSLLGGQVDVFTDLAGNAEKFGLINLALLGKERHPQFPDLPTTKELGGPELDYSIWFGMFAPRGTPDEVLTILSEACGSMAATPDYLKAMSDAKRSVAYMGTSEFAAFFKQQYEQNGDLLKAIGMSK